MIKRFIIIVALLITVVSAAQEGTSSPYSFYGIGLTKFKGTVENQSMGGIRMFSDSIHINLRNPGSYGRLRLTTFTVGGSHQSTSLKTDDAKESSRTTSLDYLAIGLPTGRLNFGLGLIPFTTVGYRILDINEEETSNRFTGRGGMNKVFLTAGYSVNDDLSIGVDVNYNFGNIQNNFTAIQNGVQFGSRQINRTDLRGFNLNFGLDYQRDINEKLKLYTVATFAPQMDITAEKMTNIATITFRADGSEVVVEENDETFPQGDLTLPSEFTLGLGLGATNKWFLGAEYSNISANDFNFNSGNSFAEVQYDNASQYRLGGFYIPEYNSLTSYFSRVVYRAGLRYEETGLNLRGEGINEFGISFGLGIPAGRFFTNANIGMEYGQRGTTNSGLLKENFFKLSISLSLNDKWFQQRKFD